MSKKPLQSLLNNLRVSDVQIVQHEDTDPPTTSYNIYVESMSEPLLGCTLSIPSEAIDEYDLGDYILSV